LSSLISFAFIDISLDFAHELLVLCSFLIHCLEFEKLLANLCKMCYEMFETFVMSEVGSAWVAL
jgi:hypothetical protein